MKYIATKKILYGSLLGVMLVLSACVNTLELAVPNGERVGVTHEGAVANAREFFNTHFGSSTRSEEQQPTPEAPYVVGDLVPDWESGVTVANSEKVYSDFAMQKDFRYFLLLGEEGDEQMQAVELYSRFVSVSEIGSDITSQYIITYIPSEEYLYSYGAVAQDYGINCSDNHEFSGVMLYTLPSGHHIAAYRYEEGKFVGGSFLYNEEQTEEENIADFVAVVEDLRIGVVEMQEGTRSDALYGGTIQEIVFVYDTGFPIFIIDNTNTGDTGNRLIDPIANDHFTLGGGGGGSTTTEEEKLTSEEFADKIIKNTLSPADSTQIHSMLTEILNDCIGRTMLQEIYDNGEQLSITFDSTANNSTFKFSDLVSKEGEIINTYNFSITLTSNFSEVLLHELFHFYQHQNVGSTDFKTAKVNYEVEAYFLTLMYLSHTTNEGVHGRYLPFCQTDIGSLLDFCSEYINPDGSFEGANKEEIEISKIFCGYYFSDASWWYKNKNPECLYDENQTIATNIKNFQILMKNCD